MGLRAGLDTDAYVPAGNLKENECIMTEEGEMAGG
jgi:hypothetical protein